MLHDPAQFNSILKQAFDAAAGIEVIGGERTLTNNTLIRSKTGNQRYASCRVEAKPGEAHVRIWEVNVDLGQRKSGLKIGRTITKAAALWAEELGKKSVAVMSVSDDGLSFWPHMGAKPAHAQLDLLGLTFMRFSNFASGEKEDKLRRLTLMARDDKSAAWFAMTDRNQPDVCLDAMTVHAIGQELYANKTLYFDLADPVVRGRIGLAPNPAI